jgi:hypothetical protein
MQLTSAVSVGFFPAKIFPQSPRSTRKEKAGFSREHSTLIQFFPQISQINAEKDQRISAQSAGVDFLQREIQSIRESILH